jgi:CheY-like chemotaxis protein
MNILILEDNASDFELMKRELRSVCLDYKVEWVQDKKTFLQALDKFKSDLILHPLYDLNFQEENKLNLKMFDLTRPLEDNPRKKLKSPYSSRDNDFHLANKPSHRTLAQNTLLDHKLPLHHSNSALSHSYFQMEVWRELFIHPLY